MNHEADADCCQQPASFNKPVYTLPRSKCPSIYAQFLLQLQICKLLLEENLHLGQQCVVPENIYNFLLHGRVVFKDPLHPTNLLVSLLPPPPQEILVLFVDGVGKSEYPLELHNLQSNT